MLEEPGVAELAADSVCGPELAGLDLEEALAEVPGDEHRLRELGVLVAALGPGDVGSSTRAGVLGHTISGIRPLASSASSRARRCSSSASAISAMAHKDTMRRKAFLQRCSSVSSHTPGLEPQRPTA